MNDASRDPDPTLRRRTVYRRTYSKWHLGPRDADRMRRRALADERACRLNYASWCGFEESGTAHLATLA